MIFTNFVVQLQYCKEIINLLLNLSCLRVNQHVNRNLKGLLLRRYKRQ